MINWNDPKTRGSSDIDKVSYWILTGTTSPGFTHMLIIHSEDELLTTSTGVKETMISIAEQYEMSRTSDEAKLKMYRARCQTLERKIMALEIELAKSQGEF